jgi:hypothetical protein
VRACPSADPCPNQYLQEVDTGFTTGQTSATVTLTGIPEGHVIQGANTYVFVTGGKGVEYATFRDFNYVSGSFAATN